MALVVYDEWIDNDDVQDKNNFLPMKVQNTDEKSFTSYMFLNNFITPLST